MQEHEAALYTSVLERTAERPEGEFPCAVCGETVTSDRTLAVAFVQRRVNLEFPVGGRGDWPAGVDAIFPACPTHSHETHGWARSRAGDLSRGVQDPRITYVGEALVWE